MKNLILILALTLTTSLFAQDESKCGSAPGPDGVQYKCGVKPGKPDVKACEKKCKEINDSEKQLVCIKSCGHKKDQHLKPKKKSCKENCLSINDLTKQKLCLKKCNGKPGKKVPSELAGCEKSDAVTITCADGVYVKSGAVNNSETIKEILDTNHHDEEHSGASEQ